MTDESYARLTRNDWDDKGFLHHKMFVRQELYALALRQIYRRIQNLEGFCLKSEMKGIFLIFIINSWNVQRLSVSPKDYLCKYKTMKMSA